MFILMLGYSFRIYIKWELVSFWYSLSQLYGIYYVLFIWRNGLKEMSMIGGIALEYYLDVITMCF